MNTKRCALRADMSGKTNMWRVVAILALSLSGCVSTKPLDQAFGAEQGRQIVQSEIAFFSPARLVRSPPARGEHERENEGQREPEQGRRHLENQP